MEIYQPSKMKVADLKELAKKLGIENTDSMNRDALIIAVQEKSVSKAEAAAIEQKRALDIGERVNNALDESDLGYEEIPEPPKDKSSNEYREYMKQWPEKKKPRPPGPEQISLAKHPKFDKFK